MEKKQPVSKEGCKKRVISWKSGEDSKIESAQLGQMLVIA